MWIIPVLIVALLVFLVVKQLRSRPASIPPVKSKEGKSHAKDNADDFETWLAILSKDTRQIRNFDLFGTRAAVLWNDGDDEVYIVCITSFSRGVPQTNKHDYFSLNVKKWYWSGRAPRGCTDAIKDQVKGIFKQQPSKGRDPNM